MGSKGSLLSVLTVSPFPTDYLAGTGTDKGMSAEASLNLVHLVWSFLETPRKPGTKAKSCGVKWDKRQWFPVCDGLYDVLSRDLDSSFILPVMVHGTPSMDQ